MCLLVSCRALLFKHASKPATVTSARSCMYVVIKVYNEHVNRQSRSGRDKFRVKFTLRSEPAALLVLAVAGVMARAEARAAIDLRGTGR